VLALTIHDHRNRPPPFPENELGGQSLGTKSRRVILPLPKSRMSGLWWLRGENQNEKDLCTFN